LYKTKLFDILLVNITFKIKHHIKIVKLKKIFHIFNQSQTSSQTLKLTTLETQIANVQAQILSAETETHKKNLVRKLKALEKKQQMALTTIDSQKTGGHEECGEYRKSMDYVPGEISMVGRKITVVKEPVLPNELYQKLYKSLSICYDIFLKAERELVKTSKTSSFLAISKFCNAARSYVEVISNKENAMVFPLIIWGGFASNSPFERMQGVRVKTFLSEDERAILRKELIFVFETSSNVMESFSKKHSDDVRMKETVAQLNGWKKMTEKIFK